MTHDFYKYHGTGNDFIMIDNRSLKFDKNDTSTIAHLCHRRFGVGGDGLILLEHHKSLDFRMVYFNADGHQSTMCGNGGRCIVAFAKQLGIISQTATFEAVDGIHEAIITNDLIKLKMQDVSVVQDFKSHQFLNTGSPHHVQICEDLHSLNVKTEGAKIRYAKPYETEGSNVNFVSQLAQNHFAIRTYERGVEDETLSCGTGATAVALAMHYTNRSDANHIYIDVEGGRLEVAFEVDKKVYKNIWLIGPATAVFKGHI